MKVFIKEQLYILDYKDEIIDCIFNSDDHNTPGYAYNINVEDSNTGYSNLSFTMPTRIIPDGEVEAIHNPKLKYVKPLTKVRYERETIYTGDKAITVSIPKGYGDTTIYEEVVYNPGDLIEIGANVDGGKFKMDYIIQPLDKKRSGLEVSMTFTAIDYPRFNLSKKRLGSTINENTLTRGEWSLYDKKPMNVPGGVQYVQWSEDLNRTVFGSAGVIPLTWDPSIASGYAMNTNQLAELLKKTEVWTYGVTATIFYWPISNSGRYEGVLYNKGDYLTLNLYEKNLVEILGSGAVLTDDENYTLVKYTWALDNSVSPAVYKYIKSISISDHEYLIYDLNQIGTEQYLGSIDASITSTPPTATTAGDWYIAKTPVRVSLDFYGYTWGFYDQGKPFLTPNNPCNYLNWILENTNWTIKLRTDKIFKGTYWNISQFPAGVANGYLMLKSIKDDEKPTYISNTYEIYQDVEDIPTTNPEGKWAIVSNSNGTNMYLWDGAQWYLSRDGLSRINTKFYEYINNQWTETTDMWTSSVDKETGVLYDVDQMDTEIAKPDSATGDLFETTQLRSSLSASDSNCYNIITELCKSFQLYPVFDCINRTVALHMFCGKNFGLTYKLGKSLENTSVKEDGEKVITKLRCYGGNDAQGNEPINLGDANRQYTKIFTGYFTTTPPTSGIEGFIAIVDPDLDEEEPWVVGENRVVKYLNGSQWSNATDNQDGTWSFTLSGVEYTVDEQTGTFAPWNPNDDQYIQARSPYGTEYIYNFKWMYDNGWMTKEDILGLYKKSLEIQDLNKGFLEDYAANYKYGYEMSVKAGVDYQTNQDEYLACLNSMMDSYYINPSSPSDGTFNAFYQVPNDVRSGGILPGENSDWHYLDTYHCYACGYTKHEAFPSKTVSGQTVYVCPNCQGYADTKHLSIRIPIWNEFTTTSDVTSPKSKGFYREVIKDVGDTLGSTYIRIGSKIPTASIQDTPGNQLKFILGSEEIYDKSSHMYNWNDYVEKWQEYYGLQLDNLVLMNKYIAICDDLEEQYNRYNKQLGELEDYIQDNWGDYIVEGKYKDDTICYTNILLAKSLEASDEYCIPKVTYTASVIDGSGLIEYRRPMNETYNDLVHSLHNIGQIVPRSGDYVSLIDEHLGLYGVPAVITSIKRSLDNPQANSITVDTSYTDNEELVGNIITATNTVLNNTDIYTRTAIIKGDGTIESTSLNKSLEQNNGDNITFVGTKGSSLLDSTGLVITDQGNAKRKMRYAGNGIFGTADNGTTWQSMMTPNGINANYINAGSIDTKYIQIMSGQNAKVVLDNLGLAVKTNENQSYHLPTTTKIYDGESVPDWDGTNLNAFIGVDKDNNSHLYVKGELVAEKGSKIGGWFIGTNNIINAVSNPTLWLSPNGKTGTILGNQANYSIYSNGNFGVTTNGNLLANGAYISGKIVVTDSSSTMNTGTVGGLTSSATGLSSGDTIIISPTGYSGTITVASGVSSSGPWAIYSKGNFGVTTGGTLWAVNGKFGGEVQAASGKIGGWTIGSNSLYSNNVSLNSNTGNTTKAINVNNGTFYVQNNGYMYSNSGTIGGWSISSDKIYKGSTTLSNTGKISFENGSAYFRMGDGTSHPEASGLSVGSAGILFGSQAANTSISGNSTDMTFTYGSGGITMKANGGADQLVLQTGGLTVNSMVNFKGGVKVNGELGATVQKFECEDPLGTPWLRIVNGIIVETSQG